MILDFSDSTKQSFAEENLIVTNIVVRDHALFEKVKSELRQNYEFSLFSILPGVFPNLTLILQQAKKIGIDPKTAEIYAAQLIETGLWELRGRRVTSKFEYLDLGGISVKEYLLATVSILSQLDDTISYAYDTLSVVTNRTIIRKFVTKINGALKELYEKSMEPGAEKTCILSWSHTGVIEIDEKNLRPKAQNRDKHKDEK